MLTAATTATGPDWPATASSTAVIVLSLVLAAVAGVLALLDKRLARWLLVLIALVEVALVVMTVQCLVAWVGGSAPLEPAVFLAYLLVCLAAGPATYWWGTGEPSRWGPGVVAVAALVIPVLVVRLQQVWTGRG
ncbi:MAG: hypothetical protein U0R68_18265 [Candidatus Nanopelagicales bacterium]